MHILIVNNTPIPAYKYGGTQRVVWWLGKELNRLGHEVSFLVGKGSKSPFGKVYELDFKRPIKDQTPQGVDVIHFNFPINDAQRPDTPYLGTIHGNAQPGEEYDVNTVFISRNHAQRHGSDVFVYNGLDPDEYGAVDFNVPRKHFLFLAKASRKEKNLKDSIKITRALNDKLLVVGGGGISFRRDLVYKGMLGGDKKNKIINESKALLFPVKWHEPFGLAIIEAMYFGCPVFGSEYGSLPELVSPDVGFLSNNLADLTNAARNWAEYAQHSCHEHVMNNFTSRQMTEGYLKLYEKVINGEQLNQLNPKSKLTSKAGLLPIY